MAKRKRAPAAYRRRRRRQRTGEWLPWALLGAVVVVVLIVGGRAWVRARTTGSGNRAEEWYDGVRGVSYNAGATEYTYPDPAAFGDGRKWLPALGDEDAPVVVMEFSEIFCGHCRDYHLEGLPEILERYVDAGQVRYVDHFFGFAGSVQQGLVHAQMCAAEQGRYFEYKHALFETVATGKGDLEEAARRAGLDMSGFGSCQDDDRYAEAVQEMVLIDNRGVRATPTFFVDGEMISGNVPDRIRQAIEEALTQIEN